EELADRVKVLDPIAEGLHHGEHRYREQRPQSPQTKLQKISSRICTVIRFFASDGPAIFTSLRLNRSPVASRKNRKNMTSVACPAKATTLVDPQNRYSRTSTAGSSSSWYWTLQIRQ